MKADGDFCGRESGHSRTACPGRWVVAVVEASEVSLSPVILAWWLHGQPRHRGCDWHCDWVQPPVLTMEGHWNWYQSLRDAAVSRTVSETVDTNHTNISRHRGKCPQFCAVIHSLSWRAYYRFCGPVREKSEAKKERDQCTPTALLTEEYCVRSSD